jgi:raffinose/stachyose/melibiose transport system substrate-binding protein
VRRRIAIIGLVSATVLTLGACSNPNSGGGGGTAVADGTAKVQAKELTVWVNAVELEAVKAVYKRFGDKYGVKMNIVEMPTDNFESGVQTRWASGERPDVLEYHATSLFWALNPEQNLYDLSKMPFASRAGDIYKDAGSHNGKVYAAITDTRPCSGSSTTRTCSPGTD